jgi:hypothetical protein
MNVFRGPHDLRAGDRALVTLGIVHRTFTERGAIWKAKRLNREDERMNEKPVRIWPKEDES